MCDHQNEDKEYRLEGKYENLPRYLWHVHDIYTNPTSRLPGYLLRNARGLTEVLNLFTPSLTLPLTSPRNRRIVP
jgi:hypothetical protein